MLTRCWSTCDGGYWPNKQDLRSKRLELVPSAGSLVLSLRARVRNSFIQETRRRVAAPPHGEKAVGPQASGPDDLWTPPSWIVSGMSKLGGGCQANTGEMISFDWFGNAGIPLGRARGDACWGLAGPMTQSRIIINGYFSHFSLDIFKPASFFLKVLL